MGDNWLSLGKCKSMNELDAGATPGFKGGEADARKATEALLQQLVGWQQKMYAQSRQRLLIVLQAMDTGGKDGLIRKVFSGVNQEGVQVKRFERPTPEELAHDYLWRVHPHVPTNGDITIFNRSHYEDVLVVRVNKLVPAKTWQRRYEHIRGFEQMLADEGTRILKFFLHIDRDEQRGRLQDRLDDPDKRWKFDPHDLEQRKLWDDYMVAYADAIRETDRKHAPWYIIPANHKWFRDLAVMGVVVDTLADMNPDYPPASFDLAAMKVV